jgi:elongation factor 1-beta
MSFSISFSTSGDLKDLNTFLASRSYVVGCVFFACAPRSPSVSPHRAPPPSPLPPPSSFTASAADAALFTALGSEPDSKKFPNVARFYKHVASLGADARAALPAVIGGAAAGGAAAAPKAAAAKAAPAAEEEDVDLFGDDGDDAAAKVKAAAPPPAAAAKKKERPVAKTICVYECKPSLAETTPEVMEAAVRSVKMEGLQWGETFKVEEIAGAGWSVKKLLVQFVCEDEKVSLFDLEDLLMELNNGDKDEDGEAVTLFQSVDQMSMVRCFCRRSAAAHDRRRPRTPRSLSHSRARLLHLLKHHRTSSAKRLGQRGSRGQLKKPCAVVVVVC